MDDKCLRAHSTAEVVTKEVRIAFEVTTFGRGRGKVCHERKFSFMSLLAPIYTI
jgi:hypothetical protein